MVFFGGLQYCLCPNPSTLILQGRNLRSQDIIKSALLSNLPEIIRHLKFLHSFLWRPTASPFTFPHIGLILVLAIEHNSRNEDLECRASVVSPDPISTSICADFICGSCHRKLRILLDPKHIRNHTILRSAAAVEKP